MIKNRNDLKKLKVIVTVVPQGKREIITDLLEEYESNFSFSVKGKGTVPNEIMSMLGLDSNERDVIFSFVRSEKAKDAILALEDKFVKFKLNQSMAFSIPLQSMVGMQNYLFLSNLGGEFLGKK